MTRGSLDDEGQSRGRGTVSMTRGSLGDKGQSR
jgi:hypothetical protein